MLGKHKDSFGIIIEFLTNVCSPYLNFTSIFLLQIELAKNVEIDA